MGITSLPVELLLSVIWSDQLEQDDVEAVRLSCHALAPAAASRLFFRIYISKLITDRDNFLAICNSPHLAQHVKEVEWLEICHALGDFLHRVPLARVRINGTITEHELGSLYKYMEAASEPLFWLFNTPTGPRRVGYDADEITTMRRNTVAAFRPVFEAAIDKLPNLRTFVSRPMTSERVLSNLDYPIAAWQFQSFQDMVLTMPETNDGLFLFILPAMGRSTSTVARLRWHDEWPGFSFLRPFPSSAFRGLESLDIFVAELGLIRSRGDDHALVGLETALMNAAPTLRHFKLNMDDFPDPDQRSSSPYIGSTIVRWLSNRRFALRSVSLCSVIVGPDVLLPLIRANATSLRHLTLDNTPGFSQRELLALARIHGLGLESIQIIPEKQVVVTENALLRFLSGKAPVSDDDREVHDLMNEAEPVFISTPPRNEAATKDECASETTSEEDHDVEYGPENRGRVFAFQVAEDSPHGHKTVGWKFTSRDGPVGYGTDPLRWFEDWDPEAGDREEPLPDCKAL
ncbi:hypothetical protein QBC41DRAFT_347236 [Cercophora samala]|uniref:F-box domain-containing protein n=1 Tax=Cercophora samala TaxID=330535 RepID=A0AA39ZCI6_9PEZI|nr:hypothetical protein QBC41DRAFT_347236 [Cercophora samala]